MGFFLSHHKPQGLVQQRLDRTKQKAAAKAGFPASRLRGSPKQQKRNTGKPKASFRLASWILAFGFQLPQFPGSRKARWRKRPEKQHSTSGELAFLLPEFGDPGSSKSQLPESQLPQFPEAGKQGGGSDLRNGIPLPV